MRADLRAKRPLLYQEVVNALYQIIDTSNLKPGDQMPAERELMEQLGVSRNVLREAFHILEQRGIITSQQEKVVFCERFQSANWEKISRRKCPKT